VPVGPLLAAGGKMRIRQGFESLDLQPYFDNDAISTAANPGDGAFNVWGNSFAAEHLPASGAHVVVDGVPFVFPPKQDGLRNNLRCAGQVIPVPPAHVDWVWLLAASERRAEDAVALHFDDGTVDFEPLRVSDFWAAPALFGETAAFVCPVMHYPHHVQKGVAATLWCQRVPAVRRAPLVRLRLPRNLAVHVFAVTLALAPCCAAADRPATMGRPRCA